MRPFALILVCLLLWAPLAVSSASLGGVMWDEMKERQQVLHEHGAFPIVGLEGLQIAATKFHNMYHLIEGHQDKVTTPVLSAPRDLSHFHNEKRTEMAVVFPDFSAAEPNQPRCGPGFVEYSMQDQNVCYGRYCRVKEIYCPDTNETIIVPPDYWNVAKWTFCTPLQLECIITGTVSIYEVIDLKEQYGATNCSIVEMFSDSTHTYFAQVVCQNKTNFGFESFGLQCETDAFVCGTTVVFGSQARQWDAQIRNGYCTVQKGFTCTANNTCYRLSVGCGYNKLDGPCFNNATVLVPCSSMRQPFCNISKVACEGVIFNASDSLPNRRGCSIYAMNCSGTEVAVNSTCIPLNQSLLCGDNGAVADFYTYNGDLSKCYMSKLQCGAELPNCSYVATFSCTRKCSYSVSRCNLSCHRPLNTSSCDCPVDRYGVACENRLDIACSASISHPPPACLPSPLPDPKDALLNGDRKCTIIDNYNGNVALGYALDCRFTTANPQNNSGILRNYTYWAQGDSISLSDPVQWNLRHKIFNMLRVYDQSNALVSETLSPEQILGQELIWFNFSLGNIGDQFWVARRLYYELAFRPGPRNTTILRAFLDSPTRPIPASKMGLSTRAVVLIILMASLFLVIVGFVGYRCYRRKKAKRDVF